MFRTTVFRAAEVMEEEEEDEGVEEVGVSESGVLEVAEGGGVVVVVGGEEEGEDEEMIQITFHKEAITSHSPNGVASILQPLSSFMPNNDSNSSGYLTHYQPPLRPLPTVHFSPNSPSNLSPRTLS